MQMMKATKIRESADSNKGVINNETGNKEATEITRTRIRSRSAIERRSVEDSSGTGNSTSPNRS